MGGRHRGLVVLALLCPPQHHTDRVIIFCVIVPSIILHEVSHGWVALAFGDDTANRAGRLTLNPVPHVDPLGTLIVPGAPGAERRWLLRLGQAGAGRPEPRCAARATRACWSPWPGRPPTLVWPSSSGVVFVPVIAPRHSAASGSFGCGPRSCSTLGLLNCRPGRLQPDPDAAARRLGASSSGCCRARWWPAYLRLRQYTLPVLMVLVMLNFCSLATATWARSAGASTSSTAGGPASSAQLIA